MSIRVEVVSVNPDGSEQRREVLTVDIPSDEDVAEWANQPGNAVPRDEVGVGDPVRESGRSAEGSVAGRGFRQSGDHPGPPLYATAERI